jgi:LysM repeat protein
MSGHEHFCPKCKQERVSRRRRKTWMRRLPRSKHYECGNCGHRFLSIFGGIIKLPLARLKKAPDVLPTDSTFTTQFPRQERVHWPRKVRQSFTPLRVSLVILALGGLIIYQGFGGKARQEISRIYRQFLPITSPPQAGPVISEPKNAPEGELVSPGTNLPKPEEKQAAPAVLPDQGKSPPENIPAKGAPLPAQEPLASAAQPFQIEIKKGESLGRIIAHYYPGDKQIGLVAIILANPEIYKDDVIYSGQDLKLPKLDSRDKTIQLQDNLFYIFYGSYYSDADLKRHTLWLKKKGIRFLVRSTKDSKGKNVNRIILGGYETKDDSVEALQGLKTKER